MKFNELRKSPLGDLGVFNFSEWTQPLLFEQRAAYLSWLQSLISEIKKIDPSKSVVLELELNQETHKIIQDLEKLKIFDSYGLNISEASFLPEFRQISEKKYSYVREFVKSQSPDRSSKPFFKK